MENLVSRSNSEMFSQMFRIVLPTLVSVVVVVLASATHAASVGNPNEQQFSRISFLDPFALSVYRSRSASELGVDIPGLRPVKIWPLIRIPFRPVVRSPFRPDYPMSANNC